MVYDADTNDWRRDCRCGEGGGFEVIEGDLERALEGGDVGVGGEGAVVVGCGGCSLMVRVNFAIADG